MENCREAPSFALRARAVCWLASLFGGLSSPGRCGSRSSGLGLPASRQRLGIRVDSGRGRAASIHAVHVIDLLDVSGASRGMLPIGAIAPANAYELRCADEGLVYRAVAAELDGFLAEAEARGHPLPSFVQPTCRDFLTCGVLEHRFLRVHCGQ